MPLDSSDDALKWVSERMDLLAFTTPTDQTWEPIYKKLRREVADQRVALHQKDRSAQALVRPVLGEFPVLRIVDRPTNLAGRSLSLVLQA